MHDEDPDEVTASPEQGAGEPAATEDPFDIVDPGVAVARKRDEEKQAAKAAAQAEEAKNNKTLDDARKAAKSEGMSEEEAAAIKDPAALHSATAALRRRNAEVQRHEAAAKAAVSGAPKKGADADRETGSGVEDLDAEIEALSEDDAIDPKTASLIKRMHGAHKAEIAALRPKPAKDVPIHKVDFHVAKLGKEFSDTFGDGPGESLASGEQRANRVKVIEAMDRIVEGARSAGRPIPTSEEAFQESLQTVFGEVVRASDAKAKADAARERQKKFLTRPSSGSIIADMKLGTDRAVAEVRRILDERGIKRGAPRKAQKF